ncbi:CCHC-type domain-containing protein [Trichonephila clavipes]|nr:CCHC-type domain-containing protein [Trichonephila clavipes]
MPTTRAMEAQFQTLLEKLSEMNANMGEMKSGLTTNIAEVNTKLTNVNEQISANMDELNNKLTANKEELKSDLKGIGDKLTTMDKKFEEMEGRIESVENKFEDMESKLEAKNFRKVADANQWDSQTKACQLAASLRADAADILQTLPETQRLDFDALVNALELRFERNRSPGAATLHRRVRDPKSRKPPNGGSQGLKGGPSVCYEIRGSPASNTKDRHSIRAVNESDTSNSGVERLERQMRSFLNRVESLMSQKADGKKTLKCWTCGREGHLQRSCRARQGAETNSASQKEVSEN